MDFCGSVIVGNVLCRHCFIYVSSVETSTDTGNARKYLFCQWSKVLQTIHMSETCTADMSSYFDDFHDVIGIPATPMCQGDFRRRRQDSPPPIPEAIGDRDLSAKWVVVDGYPLVN